jgi:hypothetical protein
MKLVVAVIQPFKPGEIGTGKIFALDPSERGANPHLPIRRCGDLRNPHLHLYGQGATS